VAEETQQKTETGSEPPKKKPADPVRRWTFILLAAAAVMLAWHLRADRVTPITSQARVNALVVPIAPEVSGTVTGVFVGNNQAVEAGQDLFQIDIERYQLDVQSAEASLEAAFQALGAAEANVKAAEASIESARANAVRAQQDYDRMRSIREEDPGALSERRLQSAEASLASAQAQLTAAEANRDKALQDLGAEGELNSRVLQARAALNQAQLNLERATVRAPEDGVITGLQLDKGNYAAAGAPQITFIATHNIWLQADFTENNLGHLEPGNEAGIVFDALPGEVIRGRVREIAYGVAVDTAPKGTLPTIQNDPNWLRQAQRYPVLIDFDLPRGEAPYPLKVGSQATVVVYTGDHLLVNPLARFYLWMVSILTYAY
jgi:multidrug resistance efflux pump